MDKIERAYSVLKKEVHWAHLMNAARRHARNRGERMSVVGTRNEVRGHVVWHYVIMDAASAARVRGLR